MNEKKRVFIIADFPPPFQGLGIHSEWVRDLLIENHLCIEFFSTTVTTSKFYRSKRVLKYFRLLLKMWKIGPEFTIYIALSAGPTIILQSLVLLKPLLDGSRIIGAHHSYLPINEPKKFIFKLTHGFLLKKIEQIYLSTGMQRSYLEVWDQPIKTWVVTNHDLAIRRIQLGKSSPRNGRTIGISHVSRLEVAKGSLRVLEIFSRLMNQDSYVSCEVLGSTSDTTIIKKIETLSQQFPLQFRYTRVFNLSELSLALHKSDIFLFPSSYRVEASPGSVLEAQAAGNIVVASNIGALPEIILDPGFVVDIEKYDQAFFDFFETFKSKKAEYRKKAENLPQKTLALAEIARTELLSIFI